MIAEYALMHCDREGCDRKFPMRPLEVLHSEMERLAKLKGWSCRGWQPDTDERDLCPTHARSSS